MSDALLEVGRLNAGYGEMAVLRDVSIAIRPAEIAAHCHRTDRGARSD